MKLIDKDALVAEIERRRDLHYKYYMKNGAGSIAECKYDEDKDILSFLDTLEVKEVDLDFQRFAKEMDAVFALPSSETNNTEEEPLNWEYVIAKHFFELGLKAQHDNWKVENLWKPADGDDLPEYDREVIVLTQPCHLEGSEYAVYFAHRPDPKGWDGKSITTGKVEHYTPKTYDKGGWNIPDIVYWLDVELPKEIER